MEFPKWKDIPKPIRVIILIIVILLLIWFGANIYRILRKPPNAHYISGGGEIPEGWTPTTITDDLFNVISGVFTLPKTKQLIFGQFNDLNDNQMIKVYNDWNDRYATRSIFLGMGSYGTLTTAATEEWNYSVIGADNEAEIMKGNLKRLKLK
ncbi:MAG: hypothetical protein V4721_16565 [Bacteroidota bacterium]